MGRKKLNLPKSLKSIDQSLHFVLVNRYGLSRKKASEVKTMYLRQLRIGDWKTPLGIDKEGKKITIRRVRASFVKRFKARDFDSYKDSRKAEILYKTYESLKLEKVKVPRALKGKIIKTPREEYKAFREDLALLLRLIREDMSLEPKVKKHILQRMERLTKFTKKNRIIIQFFKALYVRREMKKIDRKDPRTAKLIKKIYEKGTFNTQAGSKDHRDMKHALKEKEEENELEPEEADEEDDFNRYMDIYDRLLRTFLEKKDARRELVEHLKKTKKRLSGSLDKRSEAELKKMIERRKKAHEREKDAYFKAKLTPEQIAAREQLKKDFGIDLDKKIKQLRIANYERKRRKRKPEDPPKIKKAAKKKLPRRKIKKKKLTGVDE